MITNRKTAEKVDRRAKKSSEEQKRLNKIGTLNEKPLHAALKEWYSRPNDQFEVLVDGFLVDIVRGNLLVEIQARNFAAIKRKLLRLTLKHPVRLIYPIVQEKWIVKLVKGRQRKLRRRKSPKKGVLEHVFEELVSFPKLVSNPNFSIEVLFIQEEEVRRFDGNSGWRRNGWVTQERRLLQVVGQRLFKTPADIANLIPSTLSEPFTTTDLASAISKPVWLAQKMAYCLREMSAIIPVGKRRNAILYTRASLNRLSKAKYFKRKI